MHVCEDKFIFMQFSALLIRGPVEKSVIRDGYLSQMYSPSAKTD